MTPEEQHQAAVERLRKKRAAYRATFAGDGAGPHPMGVEVLKDLRAFCGMTKSGLVVSPQSTTVDPYATIYRTALRDVYLRIAGMLDIDGLTLSEDDHVSTQSPEV